MVRKLSQEEKAERDAKWEKIRAIQKEVQELLGEGECDLLWILSNSLLRTVLEARTTGLFDCLSLSQLFTLYRDVYQSEHMDSCETCFFGCTGGCEVNPGEQNPIRDFQGACRHYRREDEFRD